MQKCIAHYTKMRDLLVILRNINHRKKFGKFFFGQNIVD